MRILDRGTIKLLFETLDKLPNFAAKFNWTCCSSCGFHAITDYAEEKGLNWETCNTLFCHMQDCQGSFARASKPAREDDEDPEGDDEDPEESEGDPGDKMIADLYITWNGNGKEITECIENLGFTVEWNGDKGTRLLLKNV